MAHRGFASVLYLNNDYQGGKLCFTALDIAIKPRAGILVGFTGGFRHGHAVLRVAGDVERSTVPNLLHVRCLQRHIHNCIPGPPSLAGNFIAAP